MRPAFLNLLFLCLMTSVVQAQSPTKPALKAQLQLIVSDHLPENMLENVWYQDTVSKGLRFKAPWDRDGFYDSYKQCYRWHNYLVWESGWGGYFLGTARGPGYSSSMSNAPVATDSILVLHYDGLVVVIDTRSDTLSRWFGTGAPRYYTSIPVLKIQGNDAYILPKYIRHNRPYFEGNELHTWGVLGTNGKWLIEPKFDAPFRFQNGIADVIYYGQRRKINEKGEFVE